MFGCARQFLQQILDLDVRNHFAADFAEAAQAVGDAQKAFFIHPRDVAGVIPAIAKNVRGFFRLIEIPAHDIRAADEKQPRLVRGNRLQGVRIDDFHRDSRKGMADAAALGAHLPEGSRAKIGGVDRDRRRTFRAAVTFMRPDAEVILESLRNTIR